MPTQKNFSIVVCYYDTKDSRENHPRQLAKRCSAEIITLCEQLGMANQQLSAALRKEDTVELMHSCEFHYENFLFRIYSLRERAWDVLAALADVPRKQTGNDGFRVTVLKVIMDKYTKVHKAFLQLQGLIATDVESRNVATHQTFLWLGVAPSDDLNHFYEPYSVLYAKDPESKEGIANHKMVRRAMREFVKGHEKHFQEIRACSFKLSHEFNSAIKDKVW